ncbi:MAG: hypothetical protein Q7U05_04885 [Polaromonas sp.]|nr:hypothetical protein [Polaromonas sp.]
MPKTLMLWTLRGGDFSQPNWHAQPTAGYQLMFEFLRVSPTYELARKAKTKGLNNTDKARLPSDFERVLEMYDLFGDVNKVLFRTWWLQHGLQAFGNPFKKPAVHQVAVLAAGVGVSADQLNADLDFYLKNGRDEEGLNASVLVALPLNQKQSDVLKQIKKLLDDLKAPEILDTQAKVKLMGKRLHANAIFTGLRLLWLKSAKPNWELWRLGAKGNLSKSYSGVLDPNGPRKSKDAIEQDDRIIMSKITFRALKKFEALAENAARGYFPSDQSVELTEFEYPQIAQRLLEHTKWIKVEKARLMELSKANKSNKLSPAANRLRTKVSSH